jgi:hypothetical protein
MSNEEFTTASRGTLTVEHAELGAELWPPVNPGPNGSLTGTVAVLRSRPWRGADVCIALVRETYAHGWVFATRDFPPERAADWREFRYDPADAPAGFAGPLLSAWLDERTGGTWHVDNPARPTLHTHRYSGQSLQHDYPQGDRPHGYFGHREDSGTAHVTGKVDG